MTTTENVVVLVGVLSAAQPTNAVDLLVNGTKVDTWQITGDSAQPLNTVRLHREPGQHRFVFVSHNPPARLPTAPRLLAFAARMLHLVGTDWTTLCELQP